MNNLARLDIFFKTFFKGCSPVASYVLRTMLGLFLIPLGIIGGLVWLIFKGSCGVVRVLHKIGDKAVLSYHAMIQGRVLDDF